MGLTFGNLSNTKTYGRLILDFYKSSWELMWQNLFNTALVVFTNNNINCLKNSSSAKTSTYSAY